MLPMEDDSLEPRFTQLSRSTAWISPTAFAQQMSSHSTFNNSNIEKLTCCYCRNRLMNSAEQVCSCSLKQNHLTNNIHSSSIIKGKKKKTSKNNGNLLFFGDDSLHHCLTKPSSSSYHQQQLNFNKNKKNKQLKHQYFGASTDGLFTRHHPLLENNEIIKVVSGDFHTLFLTSDHRVIVAGKNKNGQLGLHHFNPIDEPQYLTHIENKIPCPPIIDIFCGGDYSFILTINHHIYGFGKNKIGQLGIGDTVNRRVCIPTRVVINRDIYLNSLAASSSSSSSNNGINNRNELYYKIPGENLPVKLISCGWQSTFILFENDELYVCGDNTCNLHNSKNNNNNNNNQQQQQLITTKIENFSFRKMDIPNLYIHSKIKDIQVGLFHTGIFMENGEVWISCPCCCSPIELERRKFKKKSFLDKNGKLVYSENGGEDLLKTFKIMHLAYLSTFLLSTNDIMYVSGINYCGSLGVGTSELKAYKRFTESPNLNHLNIEEIYGTNRTIVVTKEGHVYVCGSNSFGELCLEPTNLFKRKVKCTCSNDECNGNCIALPQRVLLLENEVKKRRNCKLKITCGSFHTIAYFVNIESRDVTYFYDNLFETNLKGKEYSDIDIFCNTKRLKDNLEESNISFTETKRLKLII
ncbi:hypothetical protein ABK040_014058 [Willaertia magna]